MKEILGTKLYNQTEVAALLDVTTATVRKYVKKEELQTTTIGGRKYITEEEIKRFIKALPPLK